MTSDKQIAANRRNALHSTGPKTPQGKATVRLNALRHGVTAGTAALPLLERQEDWEAHLEGVTESLAPVGYLETVFAQRVAMLLWRLGRVARYERDAIAAQIGAVDSEYSGRDPEAGSLEQLRRELEDELSFSQLISSLSQLPEETLVKHLHAVEILEIVAEEPDIRPEEFSVPGIPDDFIFEEFSGWTVGLLRQMLTAMTSSGDQSYEQVLSEARLGAASKADKIKERLERVTAAIDHKRGEQLILDMEALGKLLRYEAHLERSFYKALDGLQRLQAGRAGAPLPLPATLEVEVNHSSV